jgi:hypothetical protein
MNKADFGTQANRGYPFLCINDKSRSSHFIYSKLGKNFGDQSCRLILCQSIPLKYADFLIAAMFFGLSWKFLASN